MFKEKTYLNSYMILALGDHYLVTLEKIHNNKYGTPRYDAKITCINKFINNLNLTTYHYTFTGTYFTGLDNAIKILKYHIKKVLEQEWEE